MSKTWVDTPEGRMWFDSEEHHAMMKMQNAPNPDKSPFAGSSGIMKQIESLPPSEYKNGGLTIDKLQSILEDIFYKESIKRIKLYTSYLSMWTFNWILTYGDAINQIGYIKTFKRMKGTYITLFEKRSSYRLYVDGTTFKFYKGTKLIKTFTNVVNQWNAIGDMNDTNVPLKIKEVNTFIDSLYQRNKEERELHTMIVELDKEERKIERNYAADNSEDDYIT